MAETGERPAPAWDQIHGLRSTDIANRAKELLGIQQAITALQAEAEGHRREIELQLTAAKVDVVMVDDIRVIMVKGRVTRKLDTDKLLKLGVPMSTVSAATVESIGKSYVRLLFIEDSAE